VLTGTGQCCYTRAMVNKNAKIVLPKKSRHLISAMTAVLLGMCLTETGARAENLYSFVDNKGVVHFSNAPTDPRYKKMKVPQRPLLRLTPVSAKAVHLAILRNSEQHKVDPALVRAIIRAESSFDADAVSRKGAMGLMQLMPKTARSLKLSNPYDPQQNISGGVKYLRYLLDRFDGNVPLALAAYNAGESRVSRESRIPRISETREYVRRVLRYYKDYRQQDLRNLAAIDTHSRLAPLRYASSN
jgi:soluble lytic murein transglycosylase-like protein